VNELQNLIQVDPAWGAPPSPSAAADPKAAGGASLSSGASQNCFTAGMHDIPARELRHNVSGVLRRVESGEHLRGP
jgi:hypothetical protein